jgi:hypothetical protein
MEIAYVLDRLNYVDVIDVITTIIIVISFVPIQKNSVFIEDYKMSYVHVKSEKKIEFPRGISRCFLPTIVKAFLYQRGGFLVFYVLYQHCFICRPSDSTVTE